MSDSDYLNIGRMLSVDENEWEVTQQNPACTVRVNGPALRRFHDRFKGLAEIVSKFSSSQPATF